MFKFRCQRLGSEPSGAGFEGASTEQKEQGGEGGTQTKQPRIRTYLAEGDLAVVGAISRVPDQHLAVVLDPALPTQDIVDAGSHFVPFIVIPKPFVGRKKERGIQGLEVGGKSTKDQRGRKQDGRLTWEAGRSLYPRGLSPRICPKIYFSTSCLSKTKYLGWGVEREREI